MIIEIAAIIGGIMNSGNINSKLTVKEVLYYQWLIVKIIYSNKPLLLLWFMFETIKRQILIFFEHVYGIKYCLEIVETKQAFGRALYYLLWMICIICISEFTSAIYEHSYSLKAKPKLYKIFKEKIYEKAKELDLSCYDDPDYYNNIILYELESEKVLERFFSTSEILLQSLTTIISYGAFFLFIDKSAVVFVSVSFLLSYIFSKMYNVLIYKIRISKNPHERKRDYTRRIFYLNDYAKEVRLNPGLMDILYDDFYNSNEEINNINKDNSKKLWLLGYIKTYVSNNFIMNGIYIIFLMYKVAILHLLTLSSAVVLYTSAKRLNGSLRNLAEVFPSILENSLYVEKIESFLKYESKIISKNNYTVPLGSKCIELRNVSFAYKKEEGYVLKNINMNIKQSEKIAIVGYNGAGKTTLIKLILRLYDVTEGSIFLGNTDIKNYNIKEYRNLYGAIFQDYKIYACSIKENVVMDECDTNLTDELDNKVLKALDNSGFSERLNNMERTVDTGLISEFDDNGINLSGGENQKIAMARVFYKNPDIIILDEPSSALDPIAEYNLHSTINKFALNKTVIYISHRLSTTKNADRIYMFENGSIIEVGTHDELINLSGKYAQMWNAQTSRYKD